MKESIPVYRIFLPYNAGGNPPSPFQWWTTGMHANDPERFRREVLENLLSETSEWFGRYLVHGKGSGRQRAADHGGWCWRIIHKIREHLALGYPPTFPDELSWAPVILPALIVGHVSREAGDFLAREFAEEAAHNGTVRYLIGAVGHAILRGVFSAENLSSELEWLGGLRVYEEKLLWALEEVSRGVEKSCQEYRSWQKEMGIK